MAGAVIRAVAGHPGGWASWWLGILVAGHRGGWASGRTPAWSGGRSRHVARIVRDPAARIAGSRRGTGPLRGRRRSRVGPIPGL